MDWMVACGTEKLEIWTENGKDFSPCFSSLVFTLPASFILAVVSGYYIGKQCNWVTRKRWQLSLLLLRSCLCAGLAISPALKFYFYRGKRNLYLLEIVSLFTESTAWFVHTIYILVLRQRLSRSLRGPLPAIIGWLLFFSVHTIRLRSYIANYDPLQLNDPIFWCDVVVGILQVVFLLSLLPQGFADPAIPDETFISIRDDEFSRRASTYGQYSLDANHSYLGVAREGTSLLSRLFFSWVRPLMEKGNQETLNHLDDLFDLAHNSTSHYLRTRIMQELLINSSLVRALHRCFGKQFYLLGILKFASDSLVFVGPLLLGVLVQFIDDKTEPILFGYLCAAALCLSSFVGSLTSSHFNFGVAEISLRMRASLVAAVFTKTLSMGFADMAKFSSGEIVNMMSTDADRIVNFCQSFHALWSLPFQIGIALFLLYRQVGIAFIGGVVFAVMLIPINRIIAVQIGKLSNEMMQAKDQRVKCMHEALQGMRVIKYYAWEDHFEKKINEYREREMSALKRRKYLDAVCVYFWATTPVLVAIITFATYVAVGGKLTAAKVFTSLALFNMLITPLNAFPWVVNGIVEAWISLKRVQKLVEVPNMKPDVYYSNESRADSDSAIQVNNAELSWQSPDTSSGTFKLTDLNIKIKPGQFVGIVGKVGSGKTTLLNAIAGELVKIGGDVFVSNYPQGFSVATQEPWILHGTIRENILFGKAFDATKYKRVTEACALSPDFQQLQSGDQTLVGDNGVTLSGGQKARVALARAVYQEKDIFLLDDVLAAVDQHVAEHLVSHVVLDLLKNKTRILCTHHVRYLQAADWVIVLEEGRILMQGPPKEILPQCRDTGFFSSGEHSKPKSSLADEEAESTPNIVLEEERCTGAVKFGVMASYWNAVGSSLAAAVLGSLLLMQSSRNVSDWWLARWVSDTADNNSTNASLVEDDTSYYMGVYGGIVASNSLFTFFRAFLFAYGGLKAAKNIHNQLLSTILKAKITFFDITPLGRIINRFSSDVYAIDDALPFMLNIFLAQTFALAGTIVMTCVGIPWILLLLLPLGFVYFGLQQFYRKTSRELKRLNTVTLSPMYSHFAETLAGLLTIRATRSSSRFIQDNEDLVENNTKTQFAGQAAAQWLSLRLQLIGVTMITAVGIFAVLQHHFHTVDPGLVGLAISYALSITNVLSGVVTSFVETEKEMVSVERAEQYIERVSSENSLARVSPPHNWPSKGVIVFKNVCLKYREHLPLALKDISFATAPAEKIGIVGRTGSGKSSLLQVLFRLIDMSNGDVTIDDISIRLISTKELRSKMSIIPQDPFLFSGSVRENLDPTSRFQDSELWTALRRCHLAEAVNKCGGLDTDVLERGRLFSAGQKQLLCLARALLLNAKILCIDEATANVDCETDRLVQETIRLAFRNSTVLTVAHRIETVMDSDRVLVMSNGEVVEFETPERLLSNQASHFFKLVNHLK